jgi:hypothetical protein
MITKIDLDQLRKEIRYLSRNKALYKVLHEELTAIGHWKNKPRGDPKKAYAARGSKCQQ